MSSRRSGNWTDFQSTRPCLLYTSAFFALEDLVRSRYLKESALQDVYKRQGLLAGAVDVGSACVIYRTTPAIICQAIAGGVLGMSTFEAGWWSVVLGVALQCAMSLAIAACIVLASNQSRFLARRWVCLLHI